MTLHLKPSETTRSAVLDEAHVGHIHGALGSIQRGDHGPRTSWRRRLQTFLAILGPGLIVMVGDNDAGAFGTYAQAGQNTEPPFCGPSCCSFLSFTWIRKWFCASGRWPAWVTRAWSSSVSASSGERSASLIFSCWIALTIVTEFIGISLALSFLGVSKQLGVAIAAVVIIAAVSTGDFRRFERFALALCAGSLLLVPVFLIVNPPLPELARELLLVQFPKGAKLNEVMLLIIAIVGTTIAPWQLFFQQS